MALSTGEIKFSQIQAEFGGSAPIAMSEYYGKSTLPASGLIKLSQFHGLSNIIYKSYYPANVRIDNSILTLTLGSFTNAGTITSVRVQLSYNNEGSYDEAYIHSLTIHSIYSTLLTIFSNINLPGRLSTYTVYDSTVATNLTVSGTTTIKLSLRDTVGADYSNFKNIAVIITIE